jgi:hypothetical protein
MQEVVGSAPILSTFQIRFKVAKGAFCFVELEISR